MKLDEIITQLTDNCPTATAVKKAYGVTTADASQLPIIYVHPTLEEAGRSSADNFIVQQIECRFSVMIAADVASDALETIRDEVRAALLGFVINSDYDAVEFAVGEILEISASTIWWRDSFITMRYVRQS